MMGLGWGRKVGTKSQTQSRRLRRENTAFSHDPFLHAQNVLFSRKCGEGVPRGRPRAQARFERIVCHIFPSSRARGSWLKGKQEGRKPVGRKEAVDWSGLMRGCLQSRAPRSTGVTEQMH